MSMARELGLLEAPDLPQQQPVPAQMPWRVVTPALVQQPLRVTPELGLPPPVCSAQHMSRQVQQWW